MSEKTRTPQEVMASLFVGLSRFEQMELLSRLEFAGANIYRAFAADEKNVKAREELLKSAEREEANGKLLKLMTTHKGACEKCGTAIAARHDAHVCSFQCTFCGDCADALKSTCPNCGGQLARAA